MNLACKTLFANACNDVDFSNILVPKFRHLIHVLKCFLGSYRVILRHVGTLTRYLNLGAQLHVPTCHPVSSLFVFDI